MTYYCPHTAVLFLSQVGIECKMLCHGLVHWIPETWL